MEAQELLEAYVAAPPSKSDEYREALSDAVRTLVRKSIGKREVADLEDFEEECVLAIWTKISALRSGQSEGGIENLEAFVRRAVHNRYCDVIRRKRPRWYNLKLELLEICSGKGNVEGFALWESPDSNARLCGFSNWHASMRSASARCRQITDNPRQFQRKCLANRDPQELATYELAAAVLEFCGGPVDVDVLTGCIAELVKAQTAEPLSIDAQPDPDEDSAAPVDWLVSPDTDVESQVVDGEWFNHVVNWFWREFMQLSLKQRKAVLYGMAGDQVTALGASIGLREVAGSLEIPPAQLASLISELPLPDAVTASELGIEPRAVPSVRFKAWGRIRRRSRKSSLAEEIED